MEQCTECRIRGKRIGEPITAYYTGGRVLFLRDFPDGEDLKQGRTMSGLSDRNSLLTDLQRDTGIGEVSHASVLRCVTGTKAIAYDDYEHCGRSLVAELLSQGIKGVVAFGHVPTKLLLEREIGNIEEVRGTIQEGLAELLVVPTYSLSLISAGSCNSCGKRVRYSLIRKDIELFRAEAIRRGII